uniref:Uncharacterized protein n=1 Tax=Rhizophora mucronata TaxID=61149 RepID=A0A2P2Q741_RHIMU
MVFQKESGSLTGGYFVIEFSCCLSIFDRVMRHAHSVAHWQCVSLQGMLHGSVILLYLTFGTAFSPWSCNHS